MNRNDERNLEVIAQIIESVPAWMIKEDPVESVQDIILAAGRKSFLYKRYLDVMKQEGRFWGQVAHEFLSKGEVPRWVDFRRFIAQYTKFGKESWIELYSLLFSRYLRHLLLIVNKLHGPVLELGCGCGWLSLELARLGKNVTSIDASESSIALARFFYDHRNEDTDDVPPTFYGLQMKPPKKQGTAQYEVQDLNSLELQEKSFSAVVAWETLHHIHNLEGLVDQVRYGLKKDGVFIVHDTINEQVHGWFLHRLLTLPIVIKSLRRLFANYDAPVPEQTQRAIIDHFRNTFEPSETEKQELCSPFEGVSGKEMIRIFRKYFNVVDKSFHHHFLTEARGFNIIEKWTEHLGFAPSKRFVQGVFGSIKKIDDFLVRLARITPKHAYLVMKPKAPIALQVPLTIMDKAEQLLDKKLIPKEWAALLSEGCENIQKRIDSDLSGSDALNAFSFAETFRGCLTPSEELSSLMLIAGWHLEEGDHRWTNGNGETYFHFPEGSKKLEVEVLGAPDVSEKNPQEVVFSIQDTIIGELCIICGGWQKYLIDFDHDMPKSLVKLSIKSSSFIPKELGLSEDTRSLGVAIKCIKAKP